MKHENFGAEQEPARQEEQFETREDPRSPEEVAELVTEESEKLIANGEDEYEELVYGLSESDPKVVSLREQLTNIASRAKGLSKWAAASLALSMAQPGWAQEIPEQDGEEIVVTASAKPYKLERNNPQREGYTTSEGYRVYLDTAWETLRKSYLPNSPPSLEAIADDIYQKKLENLSPEEREGVEIRYEGRKPREEKIIEEQKRELTEFEETIKPSFAQARNLSDSEIQKQSSEYQEAIVNLDDQREWLAGVVHSQEYRRRLKTNESIDEVIMGIDDETLNLYGQRYEGMPKDPLERRKYRVTQDVLRVSDIQHPIEHGNLGRRYPEDTFTDNSNLPGRAVVDKAEAVNPESTTGLHELEHHVTEGKEGISPATNWLYGRAFNGDYIGQKYPEHPEYVEYFSRPEEIDAYKKEFEYDLEKLTDWHYGEPFTTKLLDEVQKLRDEEKLNDGSERFLDIIKPGYLMRVMNTLAQNSPDQGTGDEAREERA